MKGPPPLRAGGVARRLTPALLSAVVYPGAGQFMQRRWLAGTLFAAAFTGVFAWFLGEVWSVLTAYYEFAVAFNEAAGQAPSLWAIAGPFLASLGVWLAGLVDTAVAGQRRRDR